MNYDSVVCVNPRHLEIALKAIRSLRLFSSCNRIFVISQGEALSYFDHRQSGLGALRLLDEDRIFPGLSLSSVKDILHRRIGRDKRAGWYLQQFLKMSMSQHQEIAEYYLIWDSDTILLRTMNLFSENKVLVNPTKEYHPPYFKTMEKLLTLKRQVDFSFISEHMMVYSAYMRDLIAELSTAADSAGRTSWVGYVMANIEEHDLNGSGFSEFETYGNFIAARYPDSFVCRPLQSLRLGSRYFGENPARFDLVRLMRLGNVFVSFEKNHAGSRMRI